MVSRGPKPPKSPFAASYCNVMVYQKATIETTPTAIDTGVNSANCGSSLLSKHAIHDCSDSTGWGRVDP